MFLIVAHYFMLYAFVRLHPLLGAPSPPPTLSNRHKHLHFLQGSTRVLAFLWILLSSLKGELVILLWRPQSTVFFFTFPFSHATTNSITATTTTYNNCNSITANTTTTTTNSNTIITKNTSSPTTIPIIVTPSPATTSLLPPLATLAHHHHQHHQHLCQYHPHHYH